MEGIETKKTNADSMRQMKDLQTCIGSNFLKFFLAGCGGSYLVNRFYNPKGVNEPVIRFKKLFFTSLPILFTLHYMKTFLFIRCHKYIPEEELREFKARYESFLRHSNRKFHPQILQERGNIEPIIEGNAHDSDEHTFSNEVDFSLTKEDISTQSRLWNVEDEQEQEQPQPQQGQQPQIYKKQTKLKPLPSEMLYYTQRSSYEENRDDY